MSDRDLPVEELLGHAAWLRRLAGALVRDDDAAADVVQNTMIAAWQHPPATDRDVRPWLGEVARNLAQDGRRGERRRQAREIAATEPAAGNVATPEQLVGDLEIHRAVAEAVTALEEPFRQTIVLRYYEGLSAAEISRQTGVPAGSVRWRLKEGLDRVRARLDARYGGERKRWLAALAPLLPRPEAGGLPGGAAPATAARSGRHPAALAWFTAVGAACLLGLGGAALLAGRAGRRTDGAPLVAERAASPAVRRPSRSAGRTAPRFPSAVPTPEPGAAAPVTLDPESRLHRMLAAVKAGSYDDFLEGTGDLLKARLTREDMESVVNEVGPRLASGYRALPLGTVRKETYLEHLWKLELGDGGDDLLVTMTLADERVVGFFIK